MTYSRKDLVDAILEFVSKEDFDYQYWYVGIASDPKRRLFNEHHVPVDDDDARRIFFEANSSECARDVEAELISLGFDGGPGGGDDATTFVYVYLKLREVTNP